MCVCLCEQVNAFFFLLNALLFTRCCFRSCAAFLVHLCVCVCTRFFFISGQKQSRMEFIRWKSCPLLTYIEIWKWCKYARKFTLQNNHMVAPIYAVTVLLCFYLFFFSRFFSLASSLSRTHTSTHHSSFRIVDFGPYYIKANAVRGQCKAWFIACQNKWTFHSLFVVIDICIIESLYYCGSSLLLLLSLYHEQLLCARVCAAQREQDDTMPRTWYSRF